MAIVIILFLLHFRSALVAIITLPAGILLSFFVMHLMGINANIMSLGGIAIAIGVMVDASVVMVENLHKHRERDTGLSFEGTLPRHPSWQSRLFPCSCSTSCAVRCWYSARGSRGVARGKDD